MRFVLISDTHGMYRQVEIPDGDILIHAGDLSNVGKEYDVTDFIHWFQNLKGFDAKIFIAGNHDMSFEVVPKLYWLQQLLTEENLSQSDCYYLEDSELIIEDSKFSRPLKFYGSPWQPEFYNWAFNLPRNSSELENKWKKIPDDVDVLITHGPPNGIRDTSPHKSGFFGCEKLRERLNDLNPIIHVFGHFHDSYGAALIGNTAFINASVCTEKYKPTNKPIILDVTEVDGKLIVEKIDE